MMPELEICCDNFTSSQAAVAGGADRIELCAAIGEGGLTPSFGLIKAVKKHLDIDVHVLIRPRSGDFLYSSEEIEIIKDDVAQCKELGVEGVVIGFLKSNGEIDVDTTREVLEIAHPMKVTFHRAFDMCKDAFRALEELKQLGVDYILTSGQQAKAMEGSETIAKLVKQAKGQIKIMPASGVRTHLLKQLHQLTDAPAYHMSARKWLPSKMEYKKESVSMGADTIDKEYSILSHDTNAIKEAKSILEDLS